MPSRRTAYIVDLCSERRTRLARLLRQRGFVTEAFRDGDDALAACSYLKPGSILIVGDWPREEATDLLTRLRTRRPEMVFVVMNDDPTIPDAVRALQLGASDFIVLPYEDNQMIASLRRAASSLPDRIAHQQRVEEARKLHNALTSRERQVMGMVALGKTSRTIASELKISMRTVEMHRANIMQKLGVTSVATLGRLSLLLELLGDKEKWSPLLP